ncbi:protein shisa-5-like isoform X2 [Eriocheir sinensis]|uniref:protein shisa-5-like isoform X2 n=1 Tax=Eriocheir sinensis TaxID=95602 RepID=UPI0021C64707|nr:protein shisa-5-like isoform X2 [Eriocheir sinensis]
MEGARRLLISGGLFFCLLHAGSATRCTRENFFGQTEYFYCPEDGDASKQYCCGYGDNKYCCSTISQIDEELLDDFIDKGATGEKDGGNLSLVPAKLEAEQDSSDSSSSRSILANLRDKLNRTIASIKQGIGGAVDRVKLKTKQKVKDRIGESPLPTILGVIAAIILGFIVVCVVCCCLCPFCLIYKKRNRGTVHNPNPDVSVMQPLQNQPQGYAPPPQGAPYPAQPALYPAQPAPYPTQPGYPPQPYPPQPYPDQPPMYTEKQPPYNPTY